MIYISKLAMSKSGMMETNEDIAPQSPEILQAFVRTVGGTNLIFALYYTGARQS